MKLRPQSENKSKKMRTIEYGKIEVTLEGKQEGGKGIEEGMKK